jgi:tRNA dimethylallyltransferase
LGAAIISADSRQIYRYMDIGTAKPTAAERAAVPHFMLDLIEPSELYSSRLFRLEAERVLVLCAARNLPALVVGGTGYYVEALLDRTEVPEVSPDPALRARLRGEAESNGPVVLHDRLRALDPASASRIHPNNMNRLIRALEIVEGTGRPVPATHSCPRPALRLGLTADRATLHQMADVRIERQMRAGLLEEARNLLAMGYGRDAPGLQGFGYREMVACLEGTLNRGQAVEAYRFATHRYIRRQLTWFRRDTRITWLDAHEEPVARALDVVQRWLATGLALPGEEPEP